MPTPQGCRRDLVKSTLQHLSCRILSVSSQWGTPAISPSLCQAQISPGKYPCALLRQRSQDSYCVPCHLQGRPGWHVSLSQPVILAVNLDLWVISFVSVWRPLQAEWDSSPLLEGTVEKGNLDSFWQKAFPFWISAILSHLLIYSKAIECGSTLLGCPEDLETAIPAFWNYKWPHSASASTNVVCQHCFYLLISLIYLFSPRQVFSFTRLAGWLCNSNCRGIPHLHEHKFNDSWIKLLR